jgi:catechol 2,3-dioxygenase-like lactoylglutathione lyase family enzyme
MHPPPITAILETVLYVDDLDRAAAFYESVIGLPLLHADPRMRAFDVAGRGTLLLFPRGGTLAPVETPGGTIPPHDGHGPLHLAFAIPAAALAPWRRHLAACGIRLESTVTWPRGGTSLYVRDPDGHLLEFATPGLWQGY